jgi:hypothetical protein
MKFSLFFRFHRCNQRNLWNKKQDISNPSGSKYMDSGDRCWTNGTTAWASVSAWRARKRVMIKMRLFPLMCALPLIFLLAPVNSALSAEETTGQSGTQGKNPSSKERVVQYNPLTGMEPDGRIPKVQLPEDIKNPERWRYIPEGRIKPGNVLERLLVSSFIVPIFFFEQDIGVGGGIALTDIDFRQQKRKEFAGIFFSYTTEGQQRYSMIWQRWLHHRELADGGVAFEERSFIRGRGSYSKTLTRRFFGFGPDTTEDDETSYTDEVAGMQALIQQSLPGPGDDFVYQFSITGDYHNLTRGRVSNVPSTDDSFPILFDLGDDYGILLLSGLLRYDTRDSQHAPYKGGFFEIRFDGVPLQSNNQAAIISTVEGSWVFKVPGLFHGSGDDGEEHPPTDVIALDAFLQATEGELPFWALPTLGGRNTLRGYIANRFTDKAAWHATGEYRFWFVPRGYALTDSIRIERIGAALFYDIGTVEDNLQDLWSARIHDSYGVSLRISLERTALFRFDFGFSDEGTNFVITYGLSF